MPGMRARTTHCTSGRVSRRRGRFVPQPPDGTELSTGTPSGARSVDGVLAPGVVGGVKAGESSEGGGRTDGEAGGFGDWRRDNSASLESRSSSSPTEPGRCPRALVLGE